jgi:hypothetical protein
MDALPDPQLDVDEDVRRALKKTWASYARSERANATIDRTRGELFSETLHTARAQALDEATKILHSTKNLTEVTTQLMRAAVDYSVRTPPLIGYDEAATNYTKARKLQQCAWDINPEIPAVQPLWD